MTDPWNFTEAQRRQFREAHAETKRKQMAAADSTSVAAVLPPGCELPGCKHHYAPGRNLAAEGCICPSWFDGGGWHLIEQNPACTAHLATSTPPTPSTGEE